MADDPRLAWALCRYQAISAYLALDPPRGRRGPTLRQLAARTWPAPDGETFTVSAETLRVWIRRYRKSGLAGLEDAPHPGRAPHALDEAHRELVLRLKREVPARSLDRLIAVAEQTGQVEAGVLRRSTVHRLLSASGLSKRPAAPATSRKDLDRWEAAFPNDLWQSDLLAGPWLPDPQHPGKMKRAWLCCFLDDHSRLLLHGRFDFRQHLPTLELVFRRALQKWGIPRRCYFDNGKIYRSRHTARLCAALGVHRVVFTQVRRPEGHGKIEALNRFVTSAFLPEVAADRSIVTLEQLNAAFTAWTELEYNGRVHGQTGQKPLDRWREAAARVRYATDEELRQAFLFREARTPDKAGVFTLCGIEFQVGPKLAGRRVEIRFDPEALFEVEIWQDGALRERARPLQIHDDRRPGRVAPDGPTERRPPDKTPRTDWLGHLVAKRQAEGFAEPDPKSFAEAARSRREHADDAVVALLREHLAAEAFDEAAARDWLGRFGPLAPEAVRTQLETRFALGERTDRHVTHYLDAIRIALHGDTA